MSWLIVPPSYISRLTKSTGILILQGENDTQTPVQQAFLLQQRLTEVNHPDHTLITYPDLGHFSIHHHSGSLKVDQFNHMSCQIFMLGLKLILGLRILLLSCHHHILLRLTLTLPILNDQINKVSAI